MRTRVGLRRAASLLLIILTASAAPGFAASPSFSSSSLAGLVDAQDRTLGADPYPGKSRMVLFGFTSCADVCPLTLLAIKHSLQLLGPKASSVVPIFISVDPERDQGPQLQRYVQAFDKRIQGLSGPPDVVARVTAAHGVFFEKRWVNISSNVYVYDHTASVLIIGSDGKLIAAVSTVGPTDEVARRIAAAVETH